MWRVAVFLFFAIAVELYMPCLFVHGAKPPCQYEPGNINITYKNCSVMLQATTLSLELRHGVFSKLDADMKDAFVNYCTHSLDVNTCVLNRLASQTCSNSISEYYISMAAKSNAFCKNSGGLREDLVKLFKVSESITAETIERCRPSDFDFILCRSFADASRNTHIEVGGGHQETEYLLELSLCLYSTVIVGCRTDAVLLTLLYEIDEWLPPRLGANTTEVLRILRQREHSFY